jgi:hypothetical protein
VRKNAKNQSINLIKTCVSDKRKLKKQCSHAGLATRKGNNNRKGNSPRNLISPFVEITKLASRFESKMMMDEVEAKSKPIDDAEVDAKSKPMDDAESSPKCE